MKDGQPVHIRQVAPADRAAVTKGFESVSPQSRRLRYLAGHAVLTDAELDAITRSDGINGFAVGAELTRDDAAPVPAGIARYVRSSENPSEAELAITIADRFHGMGLGGWLLGTLAKHAALNEIERWRALVGQQNKPAKAMFEALGSRRVKDTTSRDVTFLTPLFDDPARYPDTSTGQRMRTAYALARYTRA